jgi:hypothetical protein
VTLLATAAVSTGFAEDRSPRLLVIGPVESVNAESRSAVVLGQRVRTDAATELAVGDSVAIYGLANRNASIEASAVQSLGLYVPGATPIYITGTVERAEPSVGRIVVNGIAVDLTPAMSDGMVSPGVGSQLEVSGTQPVSHGVVLMERASAVGASNRGISRIGVTGIGGVGLNGIGGVGVTGIGGVGVTGIGGVGLNGIGGVGVTGAGGVGVKGIGGVGLNGIGGVGVTGTGGVGVKGIGGVGLNGIGGVGVTGIGGVGSSASGVSRFTP